VNQVKGTNQRVATEILRVEGPEGALEFVEELVDGGERGSRGGRRPWADQEPHREIMMKKGEQAP
jgi:hypothetical protein